MPRNRPGALRATAPRVPLWTHEGGRIDRLSLPTSAAIRLAEHAGGVDYHVSPGNTARFLATYRRFLRSHPGARLRLIASECPACPGCQYDDIAVVRDALQSTLLSLPLRPRAELQCLLSALDLEFRRRTLPSLTPARGGLAWWHRRLYEGDQG
ncbi:hypothetical protein P8605_09220 [Streptomyces sp. T-3]|nr:hypothetical protein [Streptomyces sp. T-3]